MNRYRTGQPARIPRLGLDVRRPIARGWRPGHRPIESNSQGGYGQATGRLLNPPAAALIAVARIALQDPAMARNPWPRNVLSWWIFHGLRSFEFEIWPTREPWAPWFRQQCKWHGPACPKRPKRIVTYALASYGTATMPTIHGDSKAQTHNPYAHRPHWQDLDHRRTRRP